MFRPAIVLLLTLTLLTGVIYPAAVTITAQLIFPAQANGSLILHNGQPVGSTLIGQAFDDPRYFWGRPSMTMPAPYHAAASAGANLAPTSKQLIEIAKARRATLQMADPTNTQPIPIDLVTPSASGLDPHISLASAYYQAARIAQIRHMPLESVQNLIAQHTESRAFGLLGEPRVNVLQLNIALDGRE